MGRAMAHSLMTTQTLAPSELMIIELVSTLREDLAQELGCAVREKSMKTFLDSAGYYWQSNHKMLPL